MECELKNIKMGMSWTTYINSVHGVLQAAGLWEGETWQLMGETGMAFQFIIHEATCPSSVTVYDWNMVHFYAMDRVGIYTDALCINNFPGLTTYPLLQADAIRRIKQAVDAGRGVVIWAPTPILEFGIIRGYDDKEGIFYVSDCINENSDPLLYENLGKGEVSMLYIQCFQGKVDVDKEKVYRDSLAWGVQLWQQSHHNAHYANGKGAYDNLINALKTEKYDAFGLTYLVNVYADAKQCLAKYLDEIIKTSKHLEPLEESADLYRQIAGHFEKMTQITPFLGPGKAEIDKTRLPEMVELAGECRDWEDKAIAGIAGILESAG